MSSNIFSDICIIVLLSACIVSLTAESPTPFPTLYQPPDNQCSAPQSTLPSDWLLDPLTTASFLDEDDNLFWVKLYEPSGPITQRLLFNISTDYQFESRYNHILFTTDIYGNFNQDSNYYLTQINPKFFITNRNHYIGISFDNDTIRFSASSCDGSSAIPSTAIPSDTTSISYTYGTNIANTSFGGSHIQIAIESNRSESTTLVAVQWTNPNETVQYHSSCTYNTLFPSASNIVFKTASAINDDYYRFSSVKFSFCSTELNTAPNIYCEQDEFFASVPLWDGGALLSTYENITINGITEPFHGLYNKNGENYMQRTVSNPAPSRTITVKFTFLAIKVGTGNNRRYSLLYGADAQSMVSLKTFTFNATHCPNQVSHHNISGTTIDGSIGAASLICVEHYATNITSASPTFILQFDTRDQGNTDLYYAFNHLCIEETEPSISNASQPVLYTTSAPTPAPTDFNYTQCPVYESKLSDFTPLYGSAVTRLRTEDEFDGKYRYEFQKPPTKESEWLLSAPTHITMDHASSSSLTVSLGITTVVGCKDPIITIKDATQFISVQFTLHSIGFYPVCGAPMASVPPTSIHETYPDPAQNITYDNNNIEWNEGFTLNEDATIVLIHDSAAQSTTAYVHRTLADTNSLVDFSCTWNGTYATNASLNVLVAASTEAPCRITGVETTYCDLEWQYPLDFCEDIGSSSHIAVWSRANTATIAQNVVHGTFTHTQLSVDAVYFKVPPHELIDIEVTLYISGAVLTLTDTITFQIRLDENTHVIATYTGQALTECTSPWIKVNGNDTYCGLSETITDMNHTANDLNISISIDIVSGTNAFQWGFAELCFDQSFRITKSPTPAPTDNPTAPTDSPSSAPTQPPTKAPSGSPSQPPTRAPSQPPTFSPSDAPTQPPTNAPSGSPTQPPSGSPSSPPTAAPSGSPTQPPTRSPSFSPSSAPSGSPTQPPSRSPSISPTLAPSGSPTQPPSRSPSTSPTVAPSGSPTQPPSRSPSVAPTLTPSGSPSQPPTQAPSYSPTQPPSRSPSDSPSAAPSSAPTQPTVAPSGSPTQPPSESPSTSPTVAPSESPSNAPSGSPTQPPSRSPSAPPTVAPSNSPSEYPSSFPTASPTLAPSVAPTESPSNVPSGSPTQPPSRSPSAQPTIAPSDSPTQYPSGSPSAPPTLNPSVAPTIAPTMLPTGAPIARNEEKSQLRLNRTVGFCKFNCYQCLQQIDIIGTNRFWAMTFRERNTSQCECPQTTAVAANPDNKTIDISMMNPRYTLQMAKYVIDTNDAGSDDSDSEDDDEVNIQYGIRVDVLYWMNHTSNCTVSYFVNENEFFGVQAQNVLTITFTVCDVPREELKPEAIRASEQAFVQQFAQLFNVSLRQVNASILVGDFCIERDAGRRRLVQSENDQEVTVVIIFTDAEDAKAAEENACGEASAVVDDMGDCSVEIQTESQLVSQPQPMEKEIILGLTGWEIALVVVAMVIVFTVICVGCYWYESYKKKKEKRELRVKYHQQRKNTADAMGGAVARAPFMHKGVSSEDGTGIQLIQHGSITEGPLPPKTRLQGVNVSTVVSHPRGQSIEIESNSSGEAEQVPTTQLPITDTQETHGTVYLDAYKVETGNDGNSCIVHNYEDVNYLNEIADNTLLFTKEYKSEQEMIEEVIDSGKANEIEQADVVMDAQIGTGQFGAVFKATWEGNVVVVKQLNSDLNVAVMDSKQNEAVYEDGELEKLKKEKLARAKEMKAEIILASSIPTHNNLVEIYGYIRWPFGVVMSYMPGDSVQKYVYRCDKREKEEIPSILELLIILGKAASGLKFLHQYGLVHRDIACRNILLGKIHNNRIESSTEVRISDFGLTRELANKVSDDFIQKTQSTFGPLKWMAPESIKAKEYSKKSDVYMFGITMWEIFYGREPYTDMTAVNVAINVVTKQNRPRIMVDAVKYQHTEMPDGYQYVMENCWHQKASKRPTFGEVLKKLSKVASNPVRRAP